MRIVLWACREEASAEFELCLAKRMPKASIDFHTASPLSKHEKSLHVVPAVRLRVMGRDPKIALLLCCFSCACPTRRILKVRAHFGNPVAASSFGAAPQDVLLRL